MHIPSVAKKTMNIRKIKEAFHMIHKEAAPDFFRDQETVVRSLVKKLSTGNVNLQLGRYSSEHNIDERREGVCKYKFVD